MRTLAYKKPHWLSPPLKAAYPKPHRRSSLSRNFTSYMDRLKWGVETTARLGNELLKWDEPMPIYEYFCTGCGNKFERLQKITDKPVSPCPQCGKKAKRLISQTSFALKGEGWYKNGYAKGSKKEVKPEAKKTEPKEEKAKKDESKR